jgi:NADPH:quinone reductase-like Zn-dependent oxidoreductase
MTKLKAEYDHRGPVPHDVIRAVPLEIPPPADGQVLIAMVASPINPSNLLTLTGEYGVLPPLPAIGGSEGVGRVVALGAAVRDLAVDQLVILPRGSATWVTHMLAEARHLVPLPPGADPLQLAMLTINPPTASLLLSDYVPLAAGDWVIQNAGNSAVGGYVRQLARHRGLRTVSVVRRATAVAATADQAGDIVLVDGDDIAHQVREAVGGASIRLGIDAVGGSATARLAECLGEGGTVVNYGVLSGRACRIAPRELIFRDITLTGFWLVKWFRTTSAAAQRDLYHQLAQLTVDGLLHARVQATYPLERIREAVAAAGAAERDGKVLVTGAGA